MTSKNRVMREKATINMLTGKAKKDNNGRGSGPTFIKYVDRNKKSSAGSGSGGRQRSRRLECCATRSGHPGHPVPGTG